MFDQWQSRRRSGHEETGNQIRWHIVAKGPRFQPERKVGRRLPVVRALTKEL
jgi:hypothetical protein